MPSVEELSITTIRTLAMDAVQKANSGHPGTAMALAPVAYLLYEEEMRHDPGDPHWPNRDRFVLSAGHACILQYAALHLAGYDLSIDDLKAFRQWESKTPGHPEMHHTPGVETTTGPLGQGVGNSVGMALAERMLAARYNRPGPRDRRPPHVLHLLRRRPAGGRLGRGVVDRRAPRPRPADVLLRRQPHLDRGRHRPVVHRGRGRALPRLRLARAALRRHVDARHAARRRRRGARRSAAEHDHPAHAHRARRAEQAGHGERPRRAARRRRDPADEARLRLARGRRLLRARRGAPSTATGAPQGKALSTAWADAFDAYRAAHPDLAAEFERTQAGTPPDDFADAHPVVHAGRRRDGDPRGRRQGAAGARRGGARAGRRLGRPGPVHQHADEGVRQRRPPATTAAATSTGASASTAWARC